MFSSCVTTSALLYLNTAHGIPGTAAVFILSLARQSQVKVKTPFQLI